MTVAMPEIPLNSKGGNVSEEDRLYLMAMRQALLSQASAIASYLSLPEHTLPAKIRNKMCSSCRELVKNVPTE